MAKSTKSEQRKRLMLAVVGGLFVVVLVYQLFLGGAAKPTRKPANSNASLPPELQASAPQSGKGQAAKPRISGKAEEIVYTLMQDLTPLDLRGPGPSGQVAPSEERGNVFAFFVPKPPPPPPPEPEPPIKLTGVSPASAVAGTPRKITLTIVANQIPADAQLYFDSTVKQFRKLNDHQIATDLEPGEYSYQRNISITLKSASDPKMFSRPTNFTVQPGPEPQFRYIGRLGEQAIFDLTASKEIKRLSRGDVVMNQWRIDAISDQGVELTHTQYEIKRRVPLSEKTR